MNASYIKTKTGYTPYYDKMSRTWRLDIGSAVLVSRLVRQPRALQNLYDQFWQIFKSEVMERDGYRCVECGNGNTLSVDHKISRARGGCDTKENCVTLCQICHSKKHGVNVKSN